jgi:peptide-methionine (S)-S-oxide reductase
MRVITTIAALFALGGTAAAQDKAAQGQAAAVFAGGCFWCVEEAFDKLPGVLATTSGYTGGTVENPTYRQVSAGGTGHFEAVKVEYDPAQVSYEQLLDTFWKNVDPFDPIGQFCDKGDSYLSAVFVENDEEKRLAETEKTEISTKFAMPVATAILPEAQFYPAEDYHQDYYKKNPARYKYYKWGCGRAQRLEEIWGKPSA